MNTKNEIKVLKQIESICLNPEAQLRKIRLFVWGCRIIGWVVIFGSLILIKQSHVTPFAGVIIAAFGGIAVGLAIYGSMAINQWPVLKEHINTESVKEKLNELKT